MSSRFHILASAASGARERGKEAEPADKHEAIRAERRAQHYEAVALGLESATEPPEAPAVQIGTGLEPGEEAHVQRALRRDGVVHLEGGRVVRNVAALRAALVCLIGLAVCVLAALAGAR